MDKSINILVNEHKNILIVIDALLKECDGLESKKEINKDFFKKITEFIRGYADKFHHAKEEDILFIELCKDTVAMHCNPTQQMLYEHDLGRNFVKGLKKGLQENNPDEIIKNGRGYAELLKEHINKEDNILYPMAEEALDEKTKQIILKKFEEVEKKFVLENEKYLVLIKDLTKNI